MRQPKESYLSDPLYKAFVDKIEAMLHEATFTPSEVREMAMLACIRYEMSHPTPGMLRKTP